MALRHDVSAAVRRTREAQGLTQQALADRAGVSHDTVVRIEAGVDPQSKSARAPSLDVLDRLAAALGVPVATLVEGDGGDGPARARALLAVASLPDALRMLADVTDSGS